MKLALVWPGLLSGVATHPDAGLRFAIATPETEKKDQPNFSSSAPLRLNDQ